MWIRILRNTVTAPVGQPARMVDVGEVLDVEPLLALQLLVLRKAELLAAPALTPQTPEQDLIPTEIRGVAKTTRSKRSKR